MRHLVSLVLLASAAVVPVRSICYLPSGKASVQDSPCKSGDGASWCCGPGLACLSNGLCKATGVDIQNPSADKAGYVRGTCTDKTWRSTECPAWCVDESMGDRLDQGAAVERCEGDDEVYYCMNRKHHDCAKRSQVFVFESKPETLTTVGITPTTTTESSEPSSTQANTSNTETAEASTQSQESSTQGRQSSAATGDTTSQTQQASKEDGGSGGLSSGAKIGIGVGVGVAGVLAIAGIAIFFLLRRRRQRSAGVPVDGKPKEMHAPVPTHELVGDVATSPPTLTSELEGSGPSITPDSTNGLTNRSY